MKKLQYAVCLTALITIILAGCSEKDGGASDASGETANYEEIELLELEGPVNSMNFSLDEDGDTLLWGENDGGLGDDLRRYIWVNEEVKQLDMEPWDQFTVMTKSGHLLNAVADHEVDIDQKYAIFKYNPETEETEKMMAQNDKDDFLHPGHGRFLEDSKIYVHTETKPNDEEANTYIWNIEENTFTDLNFIEGIKKDIPEIKSYPHFYLNEDASTVYATVLDGGIFSYDVNAGTTEALLLSDNVMIMDKYTTALTSDEKHLVYAVNNSKDTELIVTIHALNLDTQESIEIGNGNRVFTLTNGNVAITEENKVKIFDFETQDLQTVHEIKLEENQDVDNITLSLDGSTIAYGYTTKGADDEEDTYHLRILQTK